MVKSLVCLLLFLVLKFEILSGFPISQVFNALLPTIPVLENDGFSNLICELCREKVIEFWNFRMLCLNSDVKMRLANKNPDQDATNIEQTPFTIVEIKQEATQMFEVEDEIVTHKSERRKRKRIVNFRESSFDSEEIGSNDSDFRPGKGDSNHKFSCKVCGKGFSTNYKLNRHSSVHTKKNPQTNSIRPVEKIEVIENHVEITNESLLGSKKSKASPKNVCETCKKVFPSASKLRRHAVVHMSDQEKREELKKLEMVKKYECTICATRWNFPSELIRHYKQSHHLEDDEIEKPVPKPENSTAEDTNIGKKPYLKCNKCTKQFFTDLQLRRHQYMHSELVENSKIDYQNTDHEFVCVICLHKELIYSELINHMRNAHRDEYRDKEITCKLCYKTCNSMKNIVRHAKMHEENATHKCIVCSKLFGFGEDFLAHVIRHEKTKLYLCDYCPKTFFRKNNLRTHVQKHAKYPVSPAHLCSLCGKAFNESDLLKAHVKVNLQGFLLRPNDFSVLSLFQRHAGIKPWKCNLCPKSFSCQSKKFCTFYIL